MHRLRPRIVAPLLLAFGIIGFTSLSHWRTRTLDQRKPSINDGSSKTSPGAPDTPSIASASAGGQASKRKQIKFTSATRPKPLADLDQRQVAALPAKRLADRSDAESALRKAMPGVQFDFDQITGAPRNVTAVGRLLTAANPKAANAGVVVRDFVQSHSALFGHGAAALDEGNSRLTREDVTKHNGLTTLVWQQELDGVPLYNTILKANVTKDKALVTVGSHYLTDPAGASRMQPEERQQLTTLPPVSASQAVAIAASDVGAPVDVASVKEQGEPKGAERRQSFAAAGISDTNAGLAWLPMSADELRLAWDVTVMNTKRSEMYRVLVDAKTRAVLLRRCLTNSITPATYRVYADPTSKKPLDSPAPMSPGLATPGSAQGMAATRSAVTLDALDTTASPNGWINDGNTQTVGNNVDAHLDLDADDLADTPRPNGGPGRNFDFPLNLSQSPVNYQSAAVTQLFYVNNWMHDRLYQLGFTETAGNFQTSNFSRGGLGNDAVQADAQDGSGTNNANFSTPGDGSPGRMQMYVFDGPAPSRDGDLDTEIVLHEYTHGLSNRLVGGGVGISQLQSAGMGEGWSDFYALALLSDPADDVNASYAAGAYATKNFFGLTQNYYFGIRRYPYSTDLLKNPLTFKDIDPAQAIPHDEAPHSPVFGGATDSPDEVHNQGELWCVTLWDMRANLITKHGYAIGNELTLQLVTDGMKLSPADPNFLQSRDSILQADLINNAFANGPEIWAAFAKRGMGTGAVSPDSSTTSGIIESFDLPDPLVVSPAAALVSRGPVGGAFTPASHSLSLLNAGSSSLNWTASSSEPWATLSSTSGSLLSSGTTTLNVTLTPLVNLLPAGAHEAVITVRNATSDVVQMRRLVVRAGGVDYFTQSFGSETNDVHHQSFLFTPNGSPDGYSVVRTPITELPTDPAGGETLFLADDDSVEYVIPTADLVSLYGVEYSSFFVGSNGYVTFGQGDTSFSQSPATHFALPRVAGLMSDLVPDNLASVMTLTDRVAVTWDSVPQYETGNHNTFQIDLFFDGRVRISYLDIEATNGLVGLSRGEGLPTDFVESDFSEYPMKLLQLSIPTVATEGDGLLAGQGTVTLTESSTSDTVVTLSSSNTSAATVPATVTIPADQTSATFDLSIVDDSDLDGMQLATITASAPTLSSPSAVIAVNDNETATLTITAPASVTEGDAVQTGTVTVSQAPTVDSLISLSSSDTTEVTVPGSVFVMAGQTSATFPITVKDDSFIDGTQAVTITAHVSGWTDGAANVNVLDNESHALVLTGPASIIEDSSDLAAIHISGMMETDFVVTVASSDPAHLETSATVTILAGDTSAPVILTAPANALTEGTLNASISISAAGFTGAAQSVAVLDDDVHHFTIAPIASPQHYGESIALTVSARDAGNAVLPVFTGTVSLSAGSATIAPTTSGAFIDAVWHGSASISSLGTGLTISVDDGAGHTATSNPFDIIAGDVHHFEWATVPSPQTVNVPFATTVTAKDRFNNVVSSFSQSAQLSGYTGSAQGSSVVITEINPNAGDELYFANVSALPVDVSGWVVSFYDEDVWPNRKTFTIPDGTTLAAGAVLGVREGGASPGAAPLFRTGSNISWSSEPNDVTAAMLQDANGRVIDFFCSSVATPASITSPSVISSTQWSGATVAAPINPAHVFLRTGTSDTGTSADWITAASASGVLSPSLTLPFPESENALPVIPLTSASFVNGVWSGNVTAQRGAAEMHLRATHDDATGDSNAFAVTSTGSLAITLAGSAAEGDAPLTGSVTINSAPASNLTVTLVSSDTNSITVPASVTILAGQTSASFTAMIPDDALLEGTRSALITATVPALDSGFKTVTVTDNESATLALNLPASVTEGSTINTASVSLSAAPDAPVTVNLSTASMLITLPANVTIPAGSSSVTFPITAANDDVINAPRTADVSATAAGFNTANGTFAVLDNEVLDISIVVPPTMGEGGAELGLVSLSANVEEDTVITLTSSHQARLHALSETVTILAGEHDVFFDLEAPDNDLYEPNADVTITASAPGLNNGSGILNLLNDDAHHFEFTTIGEQAPGVPFTITLSAKDADGHTMTAYHSDVLLSATGDAGPIGVDLPNIAGFDFVDGVWAGPISVLDAGLGVTLHAVSVSGTGTSNAFDMPNSGVISGLFFDDPAPLQLRDTPFPARLFVRDNNGYRITDFNDSVLVAVSDAGPMQTTLPIAPESQDMRAQFIYSPALVGPARTLQTLALHITSPPDRPLPAFTIRLKHTDLTSYDDPAAQAWTSTGWTTVYADTVTASEPGWLVFTLSTPFAYDGTHNLLVDFSFDDTQGSLNTGWVMAVPGLPNEVSFGIVGYSESMDGNPLTWTGVTPFPNPANNPPLIRFDDFVSSAFSGLSPAVVTVTNGVWSGNVTANEYGPYQFLRAAWGPAYGWSSAFDVDVLGTLTMTLPTEGTEGSALFGSVTIDVTRTEPTVVRLTSSSTAIALPTALTVTIPAGETSVPFSVSLVNDSLLTGDRMITITARADAFAGTDPQTTGGYVTVHDNDTAPFTITLPPALTEADDYYAEGGTLTVGTAPLYDLTVTLTSSDTSELFITDTVTIPAGQTSVPFDVEVVDDLIADGAQSVTVTAHVDGWTDGTINTVVHDNEAHHFSLSAIASPQGAGEPFAVTVTALDELNQPVTSYHGIPSVTASGALPVSSESLDVFENGVSHAHISVDALGTDVVLTVSDGIATGSSNAFNVVVGAVTTFTFSNIASPQTANVPFSVTITARDAVGNVVTGFSGTAVLTTSSFPISLPLELFPTPANPPMASAFVNGVWTGTVAAQRAASGVILNASISPTVDGSSNTFAVQATHAITLSLPTDAAEGGAPITGTVTLPLALASDLVVTLLSNNVNSLIVPTTVTVLAGQTTATFSATSPEDSLLEGPTSALISAGAPGYDSGLQIVNVTDNETATITLTAPVTLTEGDAPSTVTMTLSAAPAVPVWVSFTNTNWENLSVPTGLLVPAGQTSMSFQVEAYDDDLLDGPQVCPITANVDGWTDGTASITVNDNESHALTVTAPEQLAEGSFGDVTVSLGGTAVADVTVTLANSQSGRLVVPESVVIPMGTNSVTFSVECTANDLYEPNLDAEITASAVGFTNGLGTIPLVNDDPHHYSISTIPSPQAAGMAFDLTITARDPDNHVFPTYGSATLSAHAGMRSIPLDVTEVSFFDGVASFPLTAQDAGRDVVLTVTDAGAQTGSSNAFDITGGSSTSYFEWSAIDSPQVVGVPFAVTITAKDDFGLTDSNFDQRDVFLSLSENGVEPVSSWHLPLDPYIQDARTQSIYTNAEVGEARTLKSISLNVIQHPVEKMKAFTVRLKHTDRSFYDPSDISFWDNADLTVVYQGDVTLTKDGWMEVTFTTPFEYDGFNNLLVDICYNNTESGYSVSETESTFSYYARSISAQSDSMNGNPLNWNDDNAFAQTSHQLPLIRFNGQPTPPDHNITPHSVTFTQGQWTGMVRATRSGLFYPAATDSVLSIVGIANPIEVISDGALTVTLPASANEDATSVTGTVELPVASATDTTVTLTTSDATEAVPATSTVMILAGNTSATFTLNVLNDTVLDGTQLVTITASAPGFDLGSSVIAVDDSETTTLTVVLPAFISEGAGALAGTGTVTLGAAPTDDVIVSLTSSNVAELTVPDSVLVHAGQTSATFVLTAVDDIDTDGSQNVNVTAHVANWTDGIASVAVRDDEVHHFTVSPITSPTIAGQSFPITVTAQAIDDLPLPTWTGDVSLSTMAGTTFLETLAFAVTLENGTWTGPITPAVSGTGITVVVDDYLEHGGASNAFTILGDAAAWFEWSAVPTPGVVNTPVSVTITARDQWGNVADGFSGQALMGGASTTAIVSPQRTGSFVAGVWSGDIRIGTAITNKALLAYTPDSSVIGVSNNVTTTASAFLSLTLPATVVEGSAPLAGTLTISSAPASDLTINLDSSLTNAVTVPATVVIPAGQTSVPITVTVVNDNLLEGPQPALITAWATNIESATSLIQVSDDTETATLTVLLPTSVTEGQSAPAMGTVEASAPVGAPVDVALASDNGLQLDVPVMVTIPAGQTSATFPLTIIDDDYVDGAQNVTISAAVNGWTGATQTVQVNDNESNQIEIIGVPSLTEAGIETYEISIGGPVPADVEVTLTSSGPGRLTVPLSVTLFAETSSTSIAVEALDNDLADGNQNVIISAAAPGLTTGTKTVQVIDDEPHHFVFSTVQSPSTAGQPFSVTITAKNAAGRTMTNFSGVAQLTATNSAGAVEFYTNTGADITFFNGVWTDDVTFYAVADSVTLKAKMGTAGPEGTSNTFNVRAGELSFFEWSIIESPQTKDMPFTATLTARDANGYKVTTQTDVVDVAMVDQYGSGVPFMDAGPLLTASTSCRFQSIYTPTELGAPRAIDKLSLHLAAPTSIALRDFTIRVKPTTLANYDAEADQAWVTSGWTTVYRSTLPISPAGRLELPFTAPFNYTGGNLLVDFSFNNTSPGDNSERIFGKVTTDVFGNGSRSFVSNGYPEDGDPLTWTGDTPVSGTSTFLPRAQFGEFSGDYGGQVTPYQVKLTAGEWTGALTPRVSGYWFNMNAYLGSVSGTSEPFAVESLGTLAVTLPMTVAEGAGLVTGTVEIPGARTEPVVVSLRSFSPDLSLPTSIAVIPAGATSVTFRFRVEEDSLLNGTRTGYIIASAQSYDEGSNSVEITDNETATLTLVPQAPSYMEGSGAVFFLLRCDQAPLSDVTVTMTLSDPNTMTFFDNATLPAGMTEVEVVAYVLDDALVNGSRTVNVTAHVENWTDGTATVLVRDNEPRAFTIAPIGSPQSSGVPFPVTITAVNADGQPITNFHSNVGLSASNGSLLANLAISGGSFINGVWTGNFTINPMATNVVISASDTSGATGSSNAFDVQAGPLHHFEWSTITSQQLLNTPFTATVTAKDQFGNTASSFDGTANLSASGPVTTVSGTGTTAWNFPLHTAFHDARTQSIYLPAEVGSARTLTSMDLNVLTLPGQVMNTFTIRLKHTSKADYSASPTWDNTGWTTVYASTQPVGTTGWRTFNFTTPFAYNGTSNLMVDISFNNSSLSSAGSVAATNVSTPRSLYFNTNSAWGSPFTWSGSLPAGTTIARVANVRFTGTFTGLPITPTSTTAFTSGVWTGGVSIGVTGIASVTATDPVSGKVGSSGNFIVQSLGALSVSAPASASETAGSVTGSVSLPSAPAADVVVNLTSSVPSAATVPATVTILAGFFNASFPITIVDDALLDGPQTTVITASHPAASANGTASLIVNDNEVGTLSVTLPSSAAENAGALTNQGTVSITPTPTFDVTVSLASSDTTELTVPATVTIPAGNSSVTFTPTAVDDSVIDGTRSVNVTASVAGWNNGTSAINITDNESHATTVSLGSSSGNESIISVSGTLSLAAPVENATTFTLSSSSTADATVPASVTVAANASSATFTMTVINDAIYEGNEAVTITASAATFTNGTANYTIIDNDAHHFVISSIGATQFVATPFSVTITAQDASNATMTNFNGTAALTTIVGIGALNMTPTSTGSFTNGVWTGSVNIQQAGTGAVLSAVSGSAVGTSNTFDVVGLTVDHFALSAIASPQTVGTPFTVTITAQTTSNVTVPTFNGSVNINGLIGGVWVAVTPSTTPAFTNGVWTGTVTIQQPGTGIVLTVTDSFGHSGISNSFNATAPATWFNVSTIPASLQTGTNTSVTITAKDSSGATDTSFNGTVNLWPTAPGIGQIMIGRGALSSFSILTSANQDCRTQSLYTAAQLGGRACRIEGMAFYVSSPSATILNSFTIRMRHSTKNSYSVDGSAWETTNWTTCYTATQTLSTSGWVNFTFATPFDYNGTDNVMLDMSFDNSTTGTNSAIRAEPTDSVMTLNAVSPSTSGAPTTWSGTTPSPGGLSLVPQVRFMVTGGVTASSVVSGTFASGVWTGNLNFTGAAKDLVLNVADTTGRVGKSNAFALVPAAPAVTAEPAFTGGTTNAFVWSSVANATSYDAQAATDNVFTAPVLNTNVATTTATATGLVHNTPYYYRSRALRSVPHGADTWTQTYLGDFEADVRGDASLDLIQGSVALPATSVATTTLTENFDALSGGAWSSLFPVTGGNAGFAFTSSALSAGPNTTPPLPINQGGDIEGRMGGSFAWALTANTASNIFSDGSIDAYLCAETPALGISSGLIIRGGSGITATAAPVGYTATIVYSSATLASIQVGISGATISSSATFAVSNADCIHLKLAAKGNRISATAWRVAVSGSVVTETQVGTVTITDSRYSSGRVGLRGFNSSSALLIDDVTIAMDRPVFGTVGQIVSQAISPTVRSQWGTLNYTADVTGAGTSLTVDVLDGASSSVLATNVANGTNLNGISAVAAASSIKLRANLATSNTANTPLLNDWSVGYTALPNQSAASAWSNIVQSTQDSQGPVITCTPPTYATTLPFVLTGTGSDVPSGISGITAGVLATSSNGFATWSASFSSLTPGLNTFTITAGDNASPPNMTIITRSVTYVPPPTLTTVAASSVTATTATLNATINPNSTTNTAQFQYGLTTGYGSTAAITLSPNNGSTIQNIAVPISGLTPGTTYHFRVSSSTVATTYNGGDITFTTAAAPNANLSNLTLSSGTLAPVFNSALTSYTAIVVNGVSSVIATPTRSDTNATAQVRVNGGAYGATTSSLALNVGANTVDVRVTAQDGITTKTYTVVITRKTILQDWQQTNTISNLTGDDDGDGILNLAEFAFKP